MTLTDNQTIRRGVQAMEKINRARVSGQLFMAVKDGIIMDQNLTAAEAAKYRGTDIRTVRQRAVTSLPLDKVLRFRQRAA